MKAERVTELTVADEPVSTATAKLFLRVDIADDDTLIGGLITAARQYAENYCQRSFAVKTYRADLPYFMDNVHLPNGPVISIDSVKYWDTESPSVLQTWATGNYALNYDTFERNDGVSFEDVYPRTDAVQITYTAGYQDGSPLANDCPQAVIQAILLMVGDMYEYREAKVANAVSSNPTVHALLNPYREYR
jgi:uncharacterized phiE125 gp8 family phage protein